MSLYVGIALHLRRCGVPIRTPHSSVFARLASGAFYETIFLRLFTRASNFIEKCKFYGKIHFILLPVFCIVPSASPWLRGTDGEWEDLVHILCG